MSTRGDLPSAYPDSSIHATRCLQGKIVHYADRSGKRLLTRGDLRQLGGYDQVGRALGKLVEQGVLERGGQGLYRVLPAGQPRLSYSRTWNRPSGVSDEVFIASTLASPTFEDVAKLCAAFGVQRVRRVLDGMAEGIDISEGPKRLADHMIRNTEKGFAHAYRKLAGGDA